MAKKKTRTKKTKKKGVNKSKAIRDMVARRRDSSPTEVSKALKKKGINVSPAYVSTIKSNTKAKKEGRKAGVKKKKVARSRQDVSFEQLIEARQLAERLGGIDQAKRVLDALGKLS